MSTPRVSIGLPVYNGEAYLGAAIDSLLAQTFGDFELIISDNASTDRTETICRAYAVRDARVRYVRQTVNAGGAANFNHVIALARGQYFKWSAHDDVHQPEYLARCVDVLDRDPGVVLVHSKVQDVGEGSTPAGQHASSPSTDSADTATRFRALVDRRRSCVTMFGLMRISVLRRTGGLGRYADCDRVFLAKVGLAGRIREIDELLFVHRQHIDRSVWQFRSRQTRNAWFDPERAGRPLYPYTRQFTDLVKAPWQAPLSALDRARCMGVMVAWFITNLDGLWEDVTFAARHRLRPVKRKFVPSSGRPGDANRGAR